jgi:hypothetical protein
MLTRFFRCSYEVAELGRHLGEADELEFRFDKPRPSVVRLSKSYWDRQPADVASAICAAETTETTIDEEMSSEFLHGILDELYGVMIPTVAIFRWRCGLAEGPPNPGRNSKGYCSNDGKSWREVSMLRGLHCSFGIPTGPLPALDLIRNEVVELIKTSTEEPLGRQLFREAWSERETRPS